MGLVKSPFTNIAGSQPFIRTDEKDCSGFAYHLSGFNIKLPIQSGKCKSDVFFWDGVIHVKDNTQLDDKSLVGEFLYTLSRQDIIGLIN